jgi:hypothetical protein
MTTLHYAVALTVKTPLETRKILWTVASKDKPLPLSATASAYEILNKYRLIDANYAFQHRQYETYIDPNVAKVKSYAEEDEAGLEWRDLELKFDQNEIVIQLDRIEHKTAQEIAQLRTFADQHLSI